MSLKIKIFLGFFVFFSFLLGLTLYVLNIRTEEHEVTRIFDELDAAQLKFQAEIKSRQISILKLAYPLARDQKYRSFLSQIRDNFYAFTEEIANDTKADIVFMVDDLYQVRGIYPPSEKTLAWLGENLGVFKLDDVFDFGKDQMRIGLINEELFSLVSLPLKESLADDYAVGALIVGERIDNSWVDRVFSENKEKSIFQVAIFSEQSMVAGNVSQELGQAIIKGLKVISLNSGSFEFNRTRYITRRGLFDPSNKSIGYVYVANFDKAMEPFTEIQESIFSIGLMVILVGLGCSLIFSIRVVQPLRMLLSGTREVQKGNYEFQIKHKSKDEVGELSEAFNLMIKELKEKQFIQETFGKYIHPTIVAEILANPQNLKLGGERKNQTVMFSDITNFTTFSERLTPEKLIILLNKFLGAMTDELMACKGIPDQYLGDGIKAYWGPPFSKEDHSLMGCHTAIRMQKKLSELRPQWISECFPAIHMRIGLATGNMIVGNIGSEQAQEYTCIGDTVNYSSRLEGLNKFYGTEILIDYFTCRNVRHEIFIRELDFVIVKGRKGGSRIYEVMGLGEEVKQEQRQLRSQYEDALELYRKGNFELAEKRFKNVHDMFSDRPSQVMSERCHRFIANPPPEWKGIYTMTEK